LLKWVESILHLTTKFRYTDVAWNFRYTGIWSQYYRAYWYSGKPLAMQGLRIETQFALKVSCCCAHKTYYDKTSKKFLEPLSILTKYKTSVTPKIDNIFIFIYVSTISHHQDKLYFRTIFQSSSGLS
jgi:hypothetical protein